MAGDPTDSLFHRYRGLIGYAAGMYAAHSPIVDPEDLFQDGCLLMLEFFNGRYDTEDRRVHNTFKKSLFLWMRRTVKRRIKQARPKGKTMIRLNASGSIQNMKESYFFGYDRDRGGAIDIDRMLAVADTCVLAKLYAREFVAELRRVLRGLDLTVFDLMVESMTSDSVCRDIVREAVATTGVSLSAAYWHIRRVRKMAMQVLARSA